jgi:hypothetical protein
VEDNMKKLRSFVRFDVDRFFSGKELRVTGAEPWHEYIDKKRQEEPIGTKYKLVIAVDNTIYNPEKPAEDARINEGELVVVKVAKPKKEFGKFAVAKLVEPTAKVYGDYQNELSVTAKDIEFAANNRRE